MALIRVLWIVGFRLWLGIDLNLLLGSLDVRVVVCGAFCLGGTARAVV